MIMFTSRSVVSIGEAMVEMAPVGDGLYRQGFAGDTFNTIWHMAQLLQGGATVGFVTRLGKDGYSDRFVSEMISDGLDVSGVTRDAERQMGVYIIELDGVERSFQYWRGESAARGLADDVAVLKMSLRNIGLIHVSGITLAILSAKARLTLFEVLAEARIAGSVVSFDPNIRRPLWASEQHARDAVLQMLSITDIALPSFDDETSLWDDSTPSATIQRIGLHGVREIAVKNGAAPVHYSFDGKVHITVTPEVSRIRDTTGAGDGFNAGYLSARLVGQSPKRAVVAGQVLSAEIIGHIGARAPKEVDVAVRSRK